MNIETLEPRVFLAADLSIKVTYPAGNYVPGDSLPLNLTLRNTGNVAAASFHNSVVLSTNKTFGDADDVEIFSVNTENLKARGSDSVKTTITIPTNTPAAQYFVLAATDTGNTVTPEDNEVNNGFASPRANVNVGGTVSLVTAGKRATEQGEKRGKFILTRTFSTKLPLTVNYSLTGSTATNAIDVGTLPGSVTFLAGKRTTTIDVTPVDDKIAEPRENLVLTISPNSTYQINSKKNTGTVTIEDNEPTISMRVVDRTAREPSNARTDLGRVVVTRKGFTDVPISVFYTISGTAANGVDYVSLPGSVQIPAKQRSAFIEITPLAVNSSVDRTVILTLAEDLSYNIQGSDSGATVTIKRAT